MVPPTKHFSEPGRAKRAGAGQQGSEGRGLLSQTYRQRNQCLASKRENRSGRAW